MLDARSWNLPLLTAFLLRLYRISRTTRLYLSELGTAQAVPFFCVTFQRLENLMNVHHCLDLRGWAFLLIKIQDRNWNRTSTKDPCDDVFRRLIHDENFAES